MTMTLFVSATGGLGGPSRSLATVLEHMGPGGRILAAPRGSFTDLVQARQLCERRIPILDEGSGRSSTIRTMVRMAGWCRRERQRLAAIHVNGLAELNLAAPAALLSRAPVVVWAHSSIPSAWARRLAPVWRRILPRVHFAAVSSVSRNVLVDIGLCRPDAVSIIPNPVDPRDVEAAARVPSSVPTVAFIGPATPQKGYDLVLEIARRLSDQPLRWKLFVPAASTSAVLGGAEYRGLRKSLGDRLSLYPWVRDVREVYAQCDVLLCPSRTESFSRVAAEAMVNGLPVVAADLVAFRELLGDEEAGLLFPVGDVEAAAQALRRLVADPSLRSALGERGRTRAAAFDPGAVVRQFASLLHESASVPSPAWSGLAHPTKRATGA